MEINEKFSRENMLMKALVDLSNNWYVRHYGRNSGDLGLKIALDNADLIIYKIAKERCVHPLKRGEMSIKDLPIIEALVKHCAAEVGEDAYIRIYPADARIIISSLSPVP